MVVMVMVVFVMQPDRLYGAIITASYGIYMATRHSKPPAHMKLLLAPIFLPNAAYIMIGDVMEMLA